MTPQWAAVTTQSSLMREPPQKWKPVLSCRKMRRVSVPWTLPHRPGQWPPAQLSPQCLPLTHRTPLTCRDTCQGQEPGTASSPLTILERPLSTGSMAGTPQPEGQRWGSWSVDGTSRGIRVQTWLFQASVAPWHPELCLLQEV